MKNRWYISWFLVMTTAVILEGRANRSGSRIPLDPDFMILGIAERGEAIYRQNCVTCHGDTGRGDGPAGLRLRPRPYDLTDPERMSKVTDHELFLVIKEGGPSVGKSIFMTSWKGVLTDAQIHDVAAFVRTLAPLERKP